MSRKAKNTADGERVKADLRDVLKIALAIDEPGERLRINVRRPGVIYRGPAVRLKGRER